jgi:predicted metal-dependent hydrolase
MPTVEFGRTTIPYRVYRSAQRRTVSIFVDPVEGVYARAPQSLPEARVAELVRSKAKWIVGKTRKLAELTEHLPRREYVAGETYAYLGRRYRLRLIRTGNKRQARAALRGGWLCVTVGDGEPDARRREVRRQLTAWYQRRAKTVLALRLRWWAKKMAIQPPRLFIGDQRKRWGSCNRHHEVRLNWRIMLAPMRLVDYVVVHELCHTLHPNHSARFWRHLGTVMPDYEARRAQLRREGAAYWL